LSAAVNDGKQTTDAGQELHVSNKAAKSRRSKSENSSTQTLMLIL
jgi:hypothetical protein